MAKALSLSSADLTPNKPRTVSAGRPRGDVPSSDLVPLQFRMTPEFVKRYKREALERDMKLNELLEHVFDEFMKTEANS
jgi:hypothetical protein